MWFLSSPQVPFPAVTICNLQPISSSTTQGQTEYTSKIDDYYHQLERTLEHLRRKGDSSGSEKELKALMSPFGYFQNADPTIIKKTGHPEHILVPYCNWGTSDPHHVTWTPCENVSLVLDPHFYNCYTHGTSHEMNIHPGHWGKLTIIAYLDDFLNTRMETHQEFHPDSTTANSQGARLIIHVPGTLPQPSLEGFNVSPGLSLSLNVKAAEYQRLGEPYSECRDGGRISVKNQQGSFYNYSAKSCADTCLQQSIYEECGCVDAHLPRQYDLDKPDVQFCGVINNRTKPTEVARKLRCARSTYRQSEICNNQCFPSCHEYQYQVTTSQARWPHEASHISFYNAFIRGKSFQEKFAGYQEIMPKMTDGKEAEAYDELKQIDLIHRNYLQINIYMDNSELKRIEETEVFEPINLMANVGGMLNLWIGITFITIFEVAECLFLLLRTWSQKSQKTPEERYPSPHNGGLRKEIFPDSAKQGLNQPEPANV